MAKFYCAIMAVVCFIGVSTLDTVYAQSVDKYPTGSNLITLPSTAGASQRHLSIPVNHSFDQTESPVQFQLEWDIPYDRYEISRRMADGVDSLRDAKTGVAPSHLGHPGYDAAAFVYDKAVDALVLKAAGEETQARAVLDYFAARLRIPLSEVKRYADANGIYGMLKLFPSVDNAKAVGLVNAVNCRSMEREGSGQLEYWSTPGPLAFMILAFLYVDRVGYLPEALKMGYVLLAMQRSDGAIIDGDRNAVNVHTEPHMDSYSAFLMLHEVTRDAQWKTAADKAWQWFVNNVYRPEQGIIYQGIRGTIPSEVFATDTYSWTIAGRGGDRIPLNVLERLTDRMLRQSVSRVTLEVPDGTTRTVTLVDFADVKDVRINADRGGFHPMGSVEWVGGVILALQKNAVRFWSEGSPENRRKASFYKSLAEYFMFQALNSFYELEGVRGFLSFYATGQWVATGHGWQTPYFYVKDPRGNPVVRGGSTIGSWPALPLKRQNPFMLDDKYGAVYDMIPQDQEESVRAKSYVEDIVLARQFAETVPREMVKGADEIPELWRYNMQMFHAFTAGDYYAAILWAQKVVGNKDWVRMAKEQQKRKTTEVGGIVEYPWGTAEEKALPLVRMIRRYPILNEMGAAMWGMAVSNFKLGHRAEAKQWVRAVVESVPYHQIFAPDGPGYWNALVSWETNPAGTALDSQMGEIYREVLNEQGRSSGLPRSFTIKK